MTVTAQALDRRGPVMTPPEPSARIDRLRRQATGLRHEAAAAARRAASRYDEAADVIDAVRRSVAAASADARWESCAAWACRRLTEAQCRDLAGIASECRAEAVRLRAWAGRAAASGRAAA